MSDKVIRIGSQQGFAAQWDGRAIAAGGTVPSTLNLVDFEIPSGMIIDMTKSYVAFNTEITPAAGANAGGGTFTVEDPINAVLKIDGMGSIGEAYQAPNSALIRNARISCDRGQIESIRRVDTLKSALFNAEHDAEERKDDMNAFTAPKSVRGLGNQTSYFLDCVSRNTDDVGTKVTGAVSRQLARDVKVPLKSVFGIAEGADAWDTSTSKFGTTRIHMETNWKKVKVDQLGGSENTSLSFDGAAMWGQGEPQPGIPVQAAAGATNSIILTYEYTDYQQTLPFYVGERILVSATATGNGGASAPAVADLPAVIDTIQFIPGTNKVTIKTAANWFTNPGAVVQDLSAILIKADNTYHSNITVNRAELVLFTRPSMKTPDEYQYITYSTEEDNGNALTSFARGYTMEGEAEHMMVCLAPRNEILPSTIYQSYRYAVNNEDQTGNRSIFVDSPLQYDRLTRALDNQYTDWRNAQLKFARITPVAPIQANMFDKRNSTIIETLPLSARPKYVDIQIESAAGVQDIRIYKQMVKSIKA